MDWLRSELARRQQLAVLTAWAAVSAGNARAREALARALRHVWLACSFAALQHAAASRRLLRAALRSWRCGAETLTCLARSERAVSALVRRGLLRKVMAAWRARCALSSAGRAVAAQRRRGMLAAVLTAMGSHTAARRAKCALAERARCFRLRRVLRALWWCAPAECHATHRPAAPGR